MNKLLDKYMCSKCKTNIEGNAKTNCCCDNYKALSQALSTTLKPSWTELELDKVLPKKSVVLINYAQVDPANIEHCEIRKLGRNEGIDDCKQALLGQAEKC